MASPKKPTRTAWRTSSYSGSGGGQCVQVATTAGAHLARDSKDPNGPVLTFTPKEWSTFIADIKDGVRSRLTVA